MEQLYLPVVSHFQNQNIWTASIGALSYKVTPAEETLQVETWRGPWCYELSQVEERAEFPLTEEGIGALRNWLVDRGEAMNARPKETLEESCARRGTGEVSDRSN